MLNQRCAGFLLSALCTTIVAAPATAQTDQVARIIQTNSAGTNAHIIDPETHEVLAVIEGLPHVHGVAEHPEGLYYYFSNEMHSTIDVVDTRTLEVVDRIPLSGRPNNVSISKELRKLYVGIRSAPYTDVIDAEDAKAGYGAFRWWAPSCSRPPRAVLSLTLRSSRSSWPRAWTSTLTSRTWSRSSRSHAEAFRSTTPADLPV